MTSFNLKPYALLPILALLPKATYVISQSWFTALLIKQFKYCSPLNWSIKCNIFKSLVSAIAVLALGGSALAATVINKDSKIRTLIVTEGGEKMKLALHAGETVEFCPNGCFVTWPNGDLEPLTGSETIEISGGVARMK